MRTKPNTTSLKITQDVNTVNLSRTSIHDAYILEFHITLLNETGSSITPTIKNLLEAIPEIRVVSDSTRVHYSINGWDAALLTARTQKVQTDPILFRTLPSIAPDGRYDISFCLTLDEGDIVALAHTNLELSVQFAHATKENLILANATCTVTILEHICTTKELNDKYGNDLIGVAEPKVYAMTVDVPASTEFTGAMDLPNGTLIKGGIAYITNDANVMPTEAGLLRTVPDRVELIKLGYLTHREIDKIRYQTKFPEGVIQWDYGTQWQDNGVGKDGWSYSKGDIEIAVKTSVASKMRYISIEHIVNIDLYSKLFKFTEY